jgi:hypothetical protein
MCFKIGMIIYPIRGISFSCKHSSQITKNMLKLIVNHPHLKSNSFKIVFFRLALLIDKGKFNTFALKCIEF